MAVKRYIDLADLTLFKQLEDAEIAEAIRVAEARSLHTVAIDGNTLKFYREEEPVGSATPAYSITLPETDLSNYFEKFTVGETDYGKLVQVKYDPNGDGTFSAKLDKTDVTVNDLAKTSDLSPIATSGDASDVSITDEAGHFDSDNVEGALAELAAASSGGVASKTVYLKDESTGQSDYAKVYKLYQGSDAADMTENTLVGTINIPKDLFIKAASVQSVTTPDSPYDGAKVGDKYIDIEVQNQEDHLFVPVNDLVDAYTGGTTAEATVSIDDNNEITVAINKIAATKVIYQEADADSGKAEITVKAKIDSVEAKVDAIDVSGDIDGAINALNATESQTAGADGLALSITETAGVITSISGSIAANTYDAYGTGASVQNTVTGSASDTKDNLTLYGLKSYIGEVESAAETTEAVPEQDIRNLFSSASV